ncbi:MAG: twin-arginine translocation signal domain-containing protein [Bradyrhizobium sp.]|uniref:twin-arginine translocation signal domain-containing protein n=1 Tax=Bradyrhizobium sp. TaxID=376 RepID=UPI003D1441B7
MAEAAGQLITSRRNFLVRAFGLTVAGATVAVPIVTASSGREKIEYHLAELKKAFADRYGADAQITVQLSDPAPEELWAAPMGKGCDYKGGAVAFAVISATRMHGEEVKVFRDFQNVHSFDRAPGFRHA